MILRPIWKRDEAPKHVVEVYRIPQSDIFIMLEFHANGTHNVSTQTEASLLHLGVCFQNIPKGTP